MPLKQQRPFQPRLIQKFGDIEVFQIPDPYSETGYVGTVMYKGGQLFPGLRPNTSYTGNQLQDKLNQYFYGMQISPTNLADGRRMYSYHSPVNGQAKDFATREQAEAARDAEFGGNARQQLADYQKGGEDISKAVSITPPEVVASPYATSGKIVEEAAQALRPKPQFSAYTTPETFEGRSLSIQPGRPDVERILPGSQPDRQLAQPSKPVTVIDPATGLKRFNTGNPEIDNFLNKQYLPAIQSELSTDPTAIYDQNRFKDALANVDKFVEQQFGPAFKAATTRIEQEFGLKREAVTAGAREFGKAAEVKLGREEEDRLRSLAANARNYDEAKMEMQQRFTERGLTFSGIRKEQERKLEEDRARKQEDIEREATRQKEDIARQLQSKLGTPEIGKLTTEAPFIGGEFGRESRGLEMQQTEEARKLAEQRALAGAQRQKQILEFPEKLERTRQLFL